MTRCWANTDISFVITWSVKCSVVFLYFWLKWLILSQQCACRASCVHAQNQINLGFSCLWWLVVPYISMAEVFVATIVGHSSSMSFCNGFIMSIAGIIPIQTYRRVVYLWYWPTQTFQENHPPSQTWTQNCLQSYCRRCHSAMRFTALYHCLCSVLVLCGKLKTVRSTMWDSSWIVEFRHVFSFLSVLKECIDVFILFNIVGKCVVVYVYDQMVRDSVLYLLNL